MPHLNSAEDRTSTAGNAALEFGRGPNKPRGLQSHVGLEGGSSIRDARTASRDLLQINAMPHLNSAEDRTSTAGNATLEFGRGPDNARGLQSDVGLNNHPSIRDTRTRQSTVLEPKVMPHLNSAEDRTSHAVCSPTWD